jgi:hypothetical protein
MGSSGIESLRTMAKDLCGLDLTEQEIALIRESLLRLRASLARAENVADEVAEIEPAPPCRLFLGINHVHR